MDNSKPVPSTPSQSLGVFELESLLKKYLKDIEKIKNDLKEQKQMYDDTFENDIKFKEAKEKAKEVSRAKTAAKQVLAKDPSVTLLTQKIDGLKDELKDLQDALSSYAREYERISGLHEIEDDEGQIMKIVHIVKLVKDSSYKK